MQTGNNMAKNVVSSVLREKFTFPLHFMENTFNRWYPGHMAKGLRAMRAMIYKCECVIEVHDARHIPNIGRNPNFHDYVGNRPKITMYNKADLVDKEKFKKFKPQLGENVLTSNCKQARDHNIRKIVPMMLEMIRDGELSGSFDRVRKSPSYHILVCGIPNTGKSSLINVLRRINVNRGKATPVGKLPGVTRSLMNKILIHEDPKIYIFDSPGIIPPQINNLEEGMKLAAIGCFPDHFIGEDIIADYLLYTLNRNKKHRYVQVYGLPGPCDDFDIVSQFIARTTGFWAGEQPDYLNTSNHFLRQFRKGLLGNVFWEGRNDKSEHFTDAVHSTRLAEDPQ